MMLKMRGLYRKELIICLIRQADRNDDLNRLPLAQKLLLTHVPNIEGKSTSAYAIQPAPGVRTQIIIELSL